jgi:opacity protein-like surface antigen
MEGFLMKAKLWCSVSVLASLAASVGAAGAADLAVKAPVYKAAPVYLSDWAGFYLGVHGGYGWTDSSFPLDVTCDCEGPGKLISESIKQKGGVFGGHAGYNWQYGAIVTGLEVDFDGADIKGTSTNLIPSVTLKTSELASARARLGYTVLPNLLAYGTAGAGWGHTNISVPGWVDQGINQFGWTAGAGLEYKFWGNFIARAEYLHYDFDKTTATVGPQITPITETVDVVRGGVSYKF